MAVTVLPQVLVGLGLWEPPIEGSHLTDRQQGQTELRWGLSRALSAWCLVSELNLGDRAREKRMRIATTACGHHSSAINGSPAAPGCQCSSRHNVRWCGPEGTKNGESMCSEASSCFIQGRFMGVVQKGLGHEPGIDSGAWRFWKRELQELPRESCSGSVHLCPALKWRFRSSFHHSFRLGPSCLPWNAAHVGDQITRSHEMDWAAEISVENREKIRSYFTSRVIS